MGAPLKNPPVYFTIAQVRFNTILKLAEFLPAIQENLRNAGFPDFGVQKTVVLQLLSQNGQPAPCPPCRIVIHSAISIGRTLFCSSQTS